MAKQTKKAARTQRAPTVETHDSIFDHFAAHRPEYREYGTPDPATQTRPVDQTAENAELRRQIAELNARLNSSGPAIPRAPAPERQAPIEPVQFSTEGMPDPSLEPEKYNAELQRRVNATVQTTLHASQQAQQAQHSDAQRAQTLWTQFSTQYPDWAEHQDRVRFAAEAVLSEAKNKGLDTEAYISTFSDTFCADVAKKMESIFGPLEKDDEDEELDETEDTGDAGRTAGLFGGLEAGGKPAPAPGKAPPGDMIKDLQDLQRKSGFF